MTESSNQVRVGIGCMVVRDGQVLLGKRKGSHGAGEWAWPGGHLEFGESIEECVVREVAEETGLKVNPLHPLSVSNVIKYEKHYLDIQYLVAYVSGEPQVLEPEKVESWQWFPVDALPEPLFEMSKRGLTAYKDNKGLAYFSI